MCSLSAFSAVWIFLRGWPKLLLEVKHDLQLYLNFILFLSLGSWRHCILLIRYSDRSDVNAFQHCILNQHSVFVLRRVVLIKCSPSLVIENSSRSPSTNWYFFFLQHSLSSLFPPLVQVGSFFYLISSLPCILFLSVCSSGSTKHFQFWDWFSRFC